MQPPVTVTRSGPGVKKITRDIREKLRKLENSEVYVGIPAEKTTRREALKGAASLDHLNNASLLFIHTHGSALNNIPARPVIEPAIEDPENRKHVVLELGDAAKAVFDADPALATRHLKRAGMLASNAARAWFTNSRNSWAANSPATIARKGSDKPLIDTGQLRRAITSVVAEAGRISPEEQVMDEQGSVTDNLSQ